MPSPMLDAPPPAPREEAERARPPLLLPELPLGEVLLLPDAGRDLRSADVLPPDVLEAFPRRDRLLQVGQFAILPSVAVSGAYDDNRNASDSDREDDFGANLSGRIRAESLFERHSLGLEVNAALRDIDDGVDQDSFDWNSRVDGRLDLTPRSSLSGAVRFTRGTESVESPEARDVTTDATEEPTITDVAGTVAYSQSLRRLRWRIGGGISRLDAEDGDAAAKRDRTTYSVSPGADYAISNRVGVFTNARYRRNDYDLADEGGSRDSHVVEGNVGTRFGLGRTFSARLGVGYLGAFFEDDERDDEHSPTVSASLGGAISLDRVTQLRLGLDHTTDLTTVEDAALVTTSTASSSITRSLSPTSAILARVSLRRGDYLDLDRTDYDLVAQVGYSRILVRNVALNLGYRYSQRFSDDDENEFYRNIVSLGLSAHF